MKEYISEKTRGSIGILLRIPHFWLLLSSGSLIIERLLVERKTLFVFVRSVCGTCNGCGKSKTWRVDLSDVTASSVLSGEIAIEYTEA